MQLVWVFACTSFYLVFVSILKDLEHKFGEELRRMQESQKRDYREWLSKLYEDQQNGEAIVH